MKTKFIILGFFVMMLFSLRGYGQHDFQLNMSNLMLYEVNAQHEFGFADESVSFSAFGGYVYGFPSQNNRRFYYIGPELRFYPLTINGLDGFYVGMYGRYKDGYTERNQYETGYNEETNQYLESDINENIDFQKLALGFSIGMKWITRSNFIVSIHTALGRNVYRHYDNTQFDATSIKDQVSESTYYKSITNTSALDSKYWDFRFGINLGFRF